MDRVDDADSHFADGYNPQRHGNLYGPEFKYADRLLSFEAFQAKAAAAIRGSEPLLIGRYGSIEGKICGQILLGSGRVNHPEPRYHAQVAAGVFPADDETLQRFALEFAGAALQMDVCALWNFAGSKELAENFPNPAYCRLDDLTPLAGLRNQTPADPAAYPAWTRALQGLRVLVVHPFEDTIRKQHARLSTISSVRDIMPDFELLTMKPPVTFLDTDLSRRTNFFDELNAAKAQIAKLEFDVALVSAGGYGLPLAAFVKAMGRKAVHVAGAGQLLFGIIGGRWFGYPMFERMISENWVRPSAEEQVPGAEKLGQTYW